MVSPKPVNCGFTTSAFGGGWAIAEVMTRIGVDFGSAQIEARTHGAARPWPVEP
jgi:hypothetical protein